MPNYDPLSPGAVLHHLHRAIPPFRAAENRVPCVRADSAGFSQVIDSAGRMVAEAPLFPPEALVAGIGLGDGRGTLFTRAGDWLPWSCAVGLLGFLLTRRQRARGDLRPRSRRNEDDPAGR